MTRILITGASGMLGAALVQLYQDEMDVYATGSHDFPGNPARRYVCFDLQEASCAVLGEWARPQIVIHCAAITNVDACEKEPRQALAVNGDSVGKLMQACPGSRMLYVSTNAVFSGNKHMPTEEDAIDPGNAYAKSKVLGEQYVTRAGGRSCALRTTLVGRNLNPSKRSFVEWVVDSVRSGSEITLFDDVLFNPISIWDFAEELMWVMSSEVSGILHVSGREPVSKYHFGMALCDRLGLDTSSIRRGGLRNAQLVARRPNDQTLSSARYESISRRRPPDTAQTVDRLTHHFKDYHHERA